MEERNKCKLNELIYNNKNQVKKFVFRTKITKELYCGNKGKNGHFVDDLRTKGFVSLWK